MKRKKKKESNETKKKERHLRLGCKKRKEVISNNCGKWCKSLNQPTMKHKKGIIIMWR